MEDLKIGQSVEISKEHSYRNGTRYRIRNRTIRYIDRPRNVFGRVWRLSKNTYRYESFRTGTGQHVFGKATTFSAAYNELIRRYFYY
ncbi:hypothetical protein EVB81_052 [Rhizobium phage RHph_I46]|uniref:Uncharacterized protein n=1 Tax=Rhizobium phage RHph_I1_9 TaxID=2509729 RepID=A0A7S5UXL3_9CAUD|nr:hypothetical protein PP936_gp051 [Rhizobium phage RHph_I1_9]QIG69621.1 hypothetical protein EVB81_052 [Rhizobium phage RHph_I46]QIG70902.1 hypothetical protein EVB92_052 [Rhizobium phage RHph_I9]QIG73488.1 hypothetical protein EVC04_051 [Rhizobium phage RHph_I1_9]QIG76241.1 hypothetical protein EVC25_052 [Rhizobium phage RHph_I34]